MKSRNNGTLPFDIWNGPAAASLILSVELPTYRGIWFECGMEEKILNLHRALIYYISTDRKHTTALNGTRRDEATSPNCDNSMANIPCSFTLGVALISFLLLRMSQSSAHSTALFLRPLVPFRWPNYDNSRPVEYQNMDEVASSRLVPFSAVACFRSVEI